MSHRGGFASSLRVAASRPMALSPNMEQAMTLWTKRSGWMCGIFALTLATGACAFDPVDAESDDEAAAITQALTPGACTAVTLTSPTPGWTAELGQAIPLSA